ncbi:hypothetical protein RIF23_10340 [Lipingzhangella sp. LS1_29]|uniref:Uncharacterized protein n=1 Tax=Lipingzhangella rawalii TaxID=2055835 RepID=A0ABU2H5X0_9ACTN|nr:hypothetical protein [Lipingzhangella rawalii]MDS1270697.1 hypothetical protein [Lipingzhangella rawalii]
MSEVSTPTVPETLLALVGTSPLPPLHAALEFRPRKLVLAHSSDTRWRAVRIRAAAREHGGISDVELRDLGAQVSDFQAVGAGIRRFQQETRGQPGGCASPAAPR